MFLETPAKEPPDGTTYHLSAINVRVPAVVEKLVPRCQISKAPLIRTLRKPLVTPNDAVVTNAVVANCVVFVPAAAVGAVGVPVNAREPASLALVTAPAAILFVVTALSTITVAVDARGPSFSTPETVRFSAEPVEASALRVSPVVRT